jgi:hypothetical protein
MIMECNGIILVRMVSIVVLVILHSNDGNL